MGLNMTNLMADPTPVGVRFRPLPTHYAGDGDFEQFWISEMALLMSMDGYKNR